MLLNVKLAVVVFGFVFLKMAVFPIELDFHGLGCFKVTLSVC